MTRKRVEEQIVNFLKSPKPKVLGVPTVNWYVYLALSSKSMPYV